MYRTPKPLQPYKVLRPRLTVYGVLGTNFTQTIDCTVAVASEVLDKKSLIARSFAYQITATNTHKVDVANRIDYTVAISVPMSAVGGQFNKVVVTAQYLDYDGTPLAGTVTFVPNRWVINQARGQIVLVKSYSAALNSNGKISIPIPASDDPDIIPFDVLRYTVTENITDNNRVLKNVKIPLPVAPINPNQLIADDTSTAEGGTTGAWGASGTATVNVSSSSVHSGTYCHVLTSLTTGTALLTTSLAYGSPYVAPLKYYTVSAYFRPSGISKTCGIFINWLRADDGFISQSFVLGLCLTNVYTFVSNIFQSPSLAAKFTIGVGVISAAPGDVVRFDDITVEDPTGNSEYDLSSITSW